MDDVRAGKSSEHMCVYEQSAVEHFYVQENDDRQVASGGRGAMGLSASNAMSAVTGAQCSALLARPMVPLVDG